LAESKEERHGNDADLDVRFRPLAREFPGIVEQITSVEGNHDLPLLGSETARGASRAVGAKIAWTQFVRASAVHLDDSVDV
jgi:hypothetical protein